MIGSVTNKVFQKVFSNVNVNKVATKVRYAQRTIGNTVTTRKETILDKLAHFIVSKLYTSKFAQNLVERPSFAKKLQNYLFKLADKDKIIGSL